MKISCSHCHKAERVEPGTMVRGVLNGRPYRACLCAEHRQMMIDDGLVLPATIVRTPVDPYFSPAAVAERNAKMDALFASVRKKE